MINKKSITISLITMLLVNVSILDVQSKEKYQNIQTQKKEDLNKKLYDAINENNITEVKRLIRRGVKVNQKRSLSEDLKNVTPLIFASYKNYEKIVEKLIEKGADINAK